MALANPDTSIPVPIHRQTIAEVVGAIASVLLIWVVTGILVYLAIERIVEGHYEARASLVPFHVTHTFQ